MLRECAGCGSQIDDALPFCAHCGARTTSAAGAAPRLALLTEEGDEAREIVLARGHATVGRLDGDVQFTDDLFMSPVHAQFVTRDGELLVRDLGSRNGTWIFIDEPYRLQDGDTVLIGSQLLRFRRLGYPAPHPPEADQTRRLGSLTPAADVAVLAQLRADGSARDTIALSPGRTVTIGRDQGDWVFPYDKTMSGRHAQIRSEELQFVVHDDGSRNGIAVSVRGEQRVKIGQRILMGDQTVRVKSL